MASAFSLPLPEVLHSQCWKYFLSNFVTWRCLLVNGLHTCFHRHITVSQAVTLEHITFPFRLLPHQLSNWVQPQGSISIWQVNSTSDHFWRTLLRFKSPWPVAVTMTWISVYGSDQILWSLALFGSRIVSTLAAESSQMQLKRKRWECCSSPFAAKYLYLLFQNKGEHSLCTRN